MRPYVVLSIAALAALAVIPPAPSQGQEDPADAGAGDTEHLIFAQAIVRNPDGLLVAYMESTKFFELDPAAIQTFLEQEAAEGIDPTITVDGETFMVIKRTHTETFDGFDMKGSTTLYGDIDGEYVFLIRFIHDAYLVEPGDEFTSTWTFVYPM